jgi:signal peptide peptidase-like protein 2B
LQSIKIATILLTLFFAYDIFFVFITPLIFKESVMESVARGVTAGTFIDLPLLIRWPQILNPPDAQSFLMIGMGDIVRILPLSTVVPHAVSHGLTHLLFCMHGRNQILPGIFLNYLYRYDAMKRLSWKTGYYTVGMTGYVLGLLATYVSLILMQRGQPALLYLVPFILLPTILLAYHRGDLRQMWSSMDRPVQVPAFLTEAEEDGLRHGDSDDSDLEDANGGAAGRTESEVSRDDADRV